MLQNNMIPPMSVCYGLKVTRQQSEKVRPLNDFVLGPGPVQCRVGNLNPLFMWVCVWLSDHHAGLPKCVYSFSVQAGSGGEHTPTLSCKVTLHYCTHTLHTGEGRIWLRHMSSVQCALWWEVRKEGAVASGVFLIIEEVFVNSFGGLVIG